MNRRNFLTYSTAVVGGSFIGLNNSTKKILAAEYELSLNNSPSFSYVENPEIYLNFDEFKLTTQNIDTTKPVHVTINAGLPNKEEPFEKRDSKQYDDILNEDNNTHFIEDALNSNKLQISKNDLLSDIESSEDGYSFEITLQLELECDGKLIKTEKEKIEINILEYNPSEHILNYETLIQDSADEGSISDGSDWSKIMSQDIETSGEPLYIDFHTSITGANHHTFGVRILVDGEETTLVRQTDSDSTNQKMVSIFDVVDISEGNHTVTIEWKGYELNTYQTNYDRDSSVTWNIEQEANLKLMELNTIESSYTINDKTTGSMDGSSWDKLISENHTVENDNSVILFKAFISSHVIDPDSNSWNKTRITVNGEQVNFSRSGESNNGYVINSLVHAESYTKNEEIEVALEWKEDRNEYTLDGATARLGIIEFSEVSNYKVSSQSSDSAPSNWGELDSFDIDVTENLLYTQSQVSADVTNNEDFFMRLNINDMEEAWQTTGVSDDGAYDNMLISGINNIETENTISVQSQWKTEGTTTLEDSKLIALDLRYELDE